MTAQADLATRPRSIGGPWAASQPGTRTQKEQRRIDLRHLRPAASKPTKECRIDLRHLHPVASKPTKECRVDLRHLRPAASKPPGFPLTMPGATDGGAGAPRVLAAQLLLRRYYATLRSDGGYGPQTRAAVMAFQVRTRREVTGLLRPEDWAALAHESVLRVGTKGNPVRACQELLNHGLPPGDQLLVDGVLGTATLMRLQEVQRQAGLPATGVVDRATWAALLTG